MTYSFRACEALEALIEKTTPETLETSTGGSRAGGRNVLALLVESGQDLHHKSTELVLKLLKKIGKTCLNAGDWKGNTPLHCAAATGNHKVVRALVDAGANVLAENDAHQTVWQKADTNPRVKAELFWKLTELNPNGDWKNPKGSVAPKGHGGIMQKSLRVTARSFRMEERILAFR